MCQVNLMSFLAFAVVLSSAVAQTKAGNNNFMKSMEETIDVSFCSSFNGHGLELFEMFDMLHFLQQRYCKYFTGRLNLPTLTLLYLFMKNRSLPPKMLLEEEVFALAWVTSSGARVKARPHILICLATFHGCTLPHFRML